jgi:hypothetical protein
MHLAQERFGPHAGLMGGDDAVDAEGDAAGAGLAAAQAVLERRTRFLRVVIVYLAPARLQ